MEAKMREAAPPLVRYLAKMEANKKPWTMHNYPEERVGERLRAMAQSIGVEANDETISGITNTHGNNLWAAFEELKKLG